MLKVVVDLYANVFGIVWLSRIVTHCARGESSDWTRVPAHEDLGVGRTGPHKVHDSFPVTTDYKHRRFEVLHRHCEPTRDGVATGIFNAIEPVHFDNPTRPLAACQLCLSKVGELHKAAVTSISFPPAQT